MNNDYIIYTSLITSITALLTVYLKEYLFPKLSKQKLTVNKSNSYMQLDIICHKIKELVKAEGVYIAYFHNGGHFINGVGMDKYTVIGEDYSPDLKSYKSQYKDVLVNNFAYLFHSLIVSNRYYLRDLETHPNKDRGYRDDLIARGIKSTYTFIIKDPVKSTPIGFISIEYKEPNAFSEDSEMHIWKHQNEISNILNIPKD